MTITNISELNIKDLVYFQKICQMLKTSMYVRLWKTQNGDISFFYKQTVETLIRRLIWVCTVCICPTKRTLGLYGLNVGFIVKGRSQYCLLESS